MQPAGSQRTAHPLALTHRSAAGRGVLPPPLRLQSRPPARPMGNGLTLQVHAAAELRQANVIGSSPLLNHELAQLAPVDRGPCQELV